MASLPKRELAVGDPNKLIVQNPRNHHHRTQHGPNTSLSLAGSSQNTGSKRRRPQDNFRARYTDEKRAEVARVRELKACDTCRRRKVGCKHVREDHPEMFPANQEPPRPPPRKNKKPRNTASPSQHINDKAPSITPIARQPSIPFSRYLIDEDYFAARFTQRPRSKSPEGMSSWLSNLSAKIPGNDFSDSFRTKRSPPKYPAQMQMPDDTELQLSSGMTTAGYNTQQRDGPSQGFQGFASGNSGWQGPVAIPRTPSPVKTIASPPTYADVVRSGTIPLQRPGQANPGYGYGQRQDRPAAVSNQAFATNAPTRQFRQLHIGPPPAPASQQIIGYNDTLPTNHLYPRVEYLVGYNQVGHPPEPSAQDFDELVASLLEPAPSLDYNTTLYGTVPPPNAFINTGVDDQYAGFSSLPCDDFQSRPPEPNILSEDLKGLNVQWDENGFQFEKYLNSDNELSPEPEIT